MRRTMWLLGLAVSLATLSGCASSRIWVETDARVPVSATHAIHNPDGEVVSLNGYRVVKHLKAKYTHWKIGYSIFELNSDHLDAYEMLCNGEKACPEAGDTNSRMGIVNVQVKHGLSTWWNVLTIGTGTWVPFVPTSAKVHIEGDLVEFN